MRITQIVKAKSNFYEITIDDKDKFKLAEDYLIKYNFLKNKEISEEEYQLINNLANYSQIYNKTLNYLSYKMRSESEIKTYLADNKCVEPYVSEIISKLKHLNYINDEIYCQAYIKQQFDINKKGLKLIINELKNKEIKQEIIDKWIETINEEKIGNNIVSLIKYYEKINKRKTINQLKETILRNLLTKGYEYEAITSQLNNYEFIDNNNDDILLKKELMKALNKFTKKYSGYELKNRIIKTLLNKGFLYDNILTELNSLNVEG